jgi:glycosyltransferase involved in cell wall biosynthesis
MLSPVAMERSRILKATFWYLAQQRVLAGAACFHATSEEEVNDIRRLGFRQPVMLLPNGIDPPGKPELLGSIDDNPRRTLLYLGRIHPIKGLEFLLKAWAELEVKFPGWRLLIVGPDSHGHRAKLERLATSLDLVSVQFKDAVFGQDKQRLLAAASLFVLPSRSENFGVGVAEALASGTPAIVSKRAPWQGLLENDCGWWVDLSVDDLREAMTAAMSLPAEELAQMGNKGRSWMMRDFSWPNVATKMALAYQWLLYGGDKPTWLVCD